MRRHSSPRRGGAAKTESAVTNYRRAPGGDSPGSRINSSVTSNYDLGTAMSESPQLLSVRQSRPIGTEFLARKWIPAAIKKGRRRKAFHRAEPLLLKLVVFDNVEQTGLAVVPVLYSDKYRRRGIGTSVNCGDAALFSLMLHRILGKWIIKHFRGILPWALEDSINR